VSKAEGRVRSLADVEPGEYAIELARAGDRDPRLVQVVLEETREIVRASPGVIVCETHHGFVCANAGVDHSNVPGGEVLCLLPVDPDASAAGLRRRLLELTGRTVAVIVSDTFGRAWRIGIANVALGVAGMPAVIDYRGQDDDFGRTMVGTVVAITDELAGAAELAMGKTDRVPVVVIRGYRAEGEPGSGRSLVRPAAEDMFR
jgi:coenzyme F420-0:L-glutamate ligase / coenzyme F420-1:gamma-L-glutamate ligase